MLIGKILFLCDKMDSIATWSKLSQSKIQEWKIGCQSIMSLKRKFFLTNLAFPLKQALRDGDVSYLYLIFDKAKSTVGLVFISKHSMFISGYEFPFECLTALPPTGQNRYGDSTVRQNILSGLSCVCSFVFQKL